MFVMYSLFIGTIMFVMYSLFIGTIMFVIYCGIHDYRLMNRKITIPDNWFINDKISFSVETQTFKYHESVTIRAISSDRTKLYFYEIRDEYFYCYGYYINKSLEKRNEQKKREEFNKQLKDSEEYSIIHKKLNENF